MSLNECLDEDKDVAVSLMVCVCNSFKYWRESGREWIQSTNIIQSVRDSYNKFHNQGTWRELDTMKKLEYIHDILNFFEKVGKVEIRKIDLGGDSYRLVRDLEGYRGFFINLK